MGESKPTGCVYRLPFTTFGLNHPTAFLTKNQMPADFLTSIENLWEFPWKSSYSIFGRRIKCLLVSLSLQQQKIYQIVGRRTGKERKKLWSSNESLTLMENPWLSSFQGWRQHNTPHHTTKRLDKGSHALRCKACHLAGNKPSFFSKPPPPL